MACPVSSTGLELAEVQSRARGNPGHAATQNWQCKSGLGPDHQGQGLRSGLNAGSWPHPFLGSPPPMGLPVLYLPPALSTSCAGQIQPVLPCLPGAAKRLDVTPGPHLAHTALRQHKVQHLDCIIRMYHFKLF